MTVRGRLAAALGLLCLVALGAGARIGGGAAWVLAGVLVLSGVAVVLRAGVGVLSVAVAGAALALAVGVLAHVRDRTPASSPAPGAHGTPRVSAAPVQADEHAGTSGDVIVAVALLVGTGAAGVASWRLRRRDPGTAVSVVEPVREAVLLSLEDVRRERNVRRAIVACYARMERALAAVGSGRRPAETPFEYLARVLEAVAAAPARALTELYERAMFSLEPLGEREKQRAIEALELLRQAVLA